MGKRVSAWELWALACLGIWLKFFRGKVVPTTAHGTQPAAQSVAGLWQALGGGALTVVHALGVLMAVGAIVGLGILGIRLWMRRRRIEAMVAEEIILGPDDITKPDEMVAALDMIHMSLLTRYGGSTIGQVSWTFEVIRDQDGQIHFVIAAPHGWLKSIEDTWRGVYTNLRFQPWGDVNRSWPVIQQIVLERPWRHPTRIDTTYQSSVVEMMVQGLDRANGEMRLQWLLTPLPVGPLTAQLRGSLQSMEYQARAAQQNDPNHPGLGVVDRQDVSQASALLGRSAFRAEVRLAADDWDTMQRVYGAIAGSNADNQWKAQTVWAFKGLWTKWFNRRMPSIGFFGHTILFSKPLATIIHVPSARLRVQSLNRKLVRRGPAPPTIPRDPTLAILQDEIGPVGIPEGDRKFNTLFIGSQGGGKSTAMLQQIRVDTTYRDRQGRPKAMVLIDIGKDTGKRAMGIIPADREVVWFDPADPNCPWTLNPLQAGVHPSALANDVLEGLTQVFGEEAIRARSREFLGNAIIAVKDVHGDNADFNMVYQMLTNATFRQKVIDSVRDPHQRDYWQVTFTNTVANNPRFVEEGLAAPRNKLDEVLRSESVRAALTARPERQQLDLADIVSGRKVLVANLDKVRLGKSGARLLGILLITMLWHALENQNDIPEAERVPTALIIDEAQNFISEGFLDILAEGRAYGAQTTLAVRFLGEILSDRAILGVRTLVQNLVIYQFELREEAEDFMKRFMRTYSNMISPSDEAQDNINFGADDFMRLPKHHVVCRWMVDGSPQQAFLAETVPWESAYDEAVKETHLARQPRVALPPDPADWMAKERPEDLADDLTDAAAWHSEDASDTDEAFDPGWDDTTDESPIPVAPGMPAAVDEETPAGPPRWLTWMMGMMAQETWWDASSGAGLAPVWARVHQEAGQAAVWAIEGLATVNPAWAPAIRRRAVHVARTLAGPDVVLAWVTPDHLGVWLDPAIILDESIWIAQGRVRNVVWQRVPDECPALPTPVTVPDSHDASASTLDNEKGGGVMPEDDLVARPVERPPKAKGSAADPVLSADLWARFTSTTKITEERVRQWQQAAKATDAEIAGTILWVLKNHIGEEGAVHAFHKVLKDKLTDRRLDPMCDQLHTTRKALRDLLVGDDLKVWERWLKAHPDVTTLAGFRATVLKARGDRDVS